MSANPENPATKFYDQSDYTSVVAPGLQVVGTENKAEFEQKFLNDEIRGQFKLIGTHSDCFHCDEVMATSLLLRTQEFKNSIIVRTRDQEILDKLDIQCDVGGVFDAEKYRFDHHQRTFETHWWSEEDNQREEEKKQAEAKGEQLDEKKYKAPITKMSSAGLIYKYFGKEVLKNVCKSEYDITLTEEEIQGIHKKLYKGLFLELDAIDNGVNTADESRYHINTHLSARVSYLNSPWNAPKSAGYSQHNQFKKAMKICEEEFFSKLYGIVHIIMPARKIVQEAWDAREKFHPSKEFVWFETTCPWKEHLLDIEKETDLNGHIKFAFYKDGRNMVRIQALPAKIGQFDNRVSIAKALRGLRGEELSKAAGVTDAEFVHAAGFIGGAWSVESAIKIAEMSLKEHNEEQEKVEQNAEKKQKSE